MLILEVHKGLIMKGKGITCNQTKMVAIISPVFGALR